jgi:acetyl-CoA carboxylase carboxyltransferase component
VGIVANQKLHAQQTDHEGHKRIEFGGVIYTESAEKAARFIMDCNQNLIPLVFFHDVNGFMVGRDAEWSGIIKAGAKMVNAVSNSVVPKIAVIVGGSFGAGHYAMCGKAFDPRFVFAWPTAKYAVMSGDAAAGTLVEIKVKQLERSGKKLSDEEKKRTFRFDQENLRRANRPALRRRPALDRQDHRSHGNAASHHAGAGSGVAESRRAGVQGGSAANMIHHGDTETRSKLLYLKLIKHVGMKH